MKINHLILGVRDLELTLNFYSKYFGYALEKEFLDTGTNSKGYLLRNNNAPTLLLVVFPECRLPSPQHIAFETNYENLIELYNFISLSHKVRKDPDLNCLDPSIGDFLDNEVNYKRFYILDPNNINIEIMAPLNA